MADAKAVEGEAEDRVRPALGAGDGVVLGGDSDDLAGRRVERAGGRADRDRVAADGLDAVVVAVLVRDQQQVGLEPLDRRVVEVDAVRGRGRHVAERVDRDAAPRR